MTECCAHRVYCEWHRIFQVKSARFTKTKFKPDNYETLFLRKKKLLNRPDLFAFHAMSFIALDDININYITATRQCNKKYLVLLSEAIETIYKMESKH
jgi:hypothetical protein